MMENIPFGSQNFWKWVYIILHKPGVALALVCWVFKFCRSFIPTFVLASLLKSFQYNKAEDHCACPNAFIYNYVSLISLGLW